VKLDTALTRILKSVAIVGLFLLAVFITAVEIAALKNHATVSWHWHVGATLIISFCLCAAYLLIKRPADPYATVYCQRCHTLGGHTPVSSYRGSVSPFAYHFGGFIFSIFYAASRKQKFRCRQCSETFEAHTTTSRGYRLLYILMFALIVNFFWSEIDEFWE
jgi:hypothetical protein